MFWELLTTCSSNYYIPLLKHLSSSIFLQYQLHRKTTIFSLEMDAGEGLVFAKRPTWCFCSAVCMVQQGGFSTRLYLGRPWWIVTEGLQRNRWLGQKGPDECLKHMFDESDLGFLDFIKTLNVILCSAVKKWGHQSVTFVCHCSPLCNVLVSETGGHILFLQTLQFKK